MKLTMNCRRALGLGCAAALVLWALGCARPQPGLWPPEPGAPSVTLRVYQTGLHSLIEFPLPGPSPAVESWAYGERLWFYEDRHPLREGAREVASRSSGAFHALFWPSDGVVEVTRSGAPLFQREPADVKRGWELRLSPEGLARLRAWLARQQGSATPLFDEGGQAYYPATRRYWIFFTCHHFTADALWEAGVPIHASWCFLPAGLWWQLDARAQRLAP